MPTAATRVFAVLGDPVGHSLSPRIQNAALSATGLDGVYVALRCDTDALAGLLRGLALSGGGGNVTLPHKALAAKTVERPSAAVRRTGACNTFWLEDGRTCGDNTDVPGFLAAAQSLIGPPAGARVLLIGAGGAARAALAALLDARADAVVLHNRTPERAAELRDTFDPAGRRVRLLGDAPKLRSEGFDLIINATSVGLRTEDPLPLNLSDVLRAGAVLDLVYAADETAWVRHARACGVPAADGLEMLIQQGAAAFTHWWGLPAPVDAMRAAVQESARRGPAKPAARRKTIPPAR